MIKPEQPRIEIDDLAAVIRESMAAQKHHDRFRQWVVRSGGAERRAFALP
jgi:hypothetical protein